MRLLILLLFVGACTGPSFTHHRTNANPTLRNGRFHECPDDHWFNGVRCVLLETEESPYK